MQKANIRAEFVSQADDAVRQRIKSVRVQQGITQAVVARELGIVPQQYHKYESGSLRLSSGMLLQIARVLDCSILDLIPAAATGYAALDPVKKLDVLKQELSLLVLDAQSSDLLVAMKTLLEHARLQGGDTAVY